MSYNRGERIKFERNMLIRIGIVIAIFIILIYLMSSSNSEFTSNLEGTVISRNGKEYSIKVSRIEITSNELTFTELQNANIELYSTKRIFWISATEIQVFDGENLISNGSGVFFGCQRIFENLIENGPHYTFWSNS